jgi:hypothetical protein
MGLGNFMLLFGIVLTTDYKVLQQNMLKEPYLMKLLLTDLILVQFIQNEDPLDR